MIDFILTLSVFSLSDNFDTILSVTDKFSKTIILILRCKIMTAKDWAIRLMNHLALLNWDLSWAILLNRDCKFTVTLWKELFHQLCINLLFSTAYHPQTDDSSEVTNQVTEVALCHWLITLKQSAEWSVILPHLQAALNNSTKYSLMNLSSNQILFEFQTHETLNLLWTDDSNIINIVKTNTYLTQSTTDQSHFNRIFSQVKLSNTSHPSKHVKLVILDQYRSAHIDVKNVIAFAALQMKFYYDKKHESLFFKVRDMINLHLHHSYTLPDLKTNKKLSQQFVDLIWILKHLEHLTYCLDISTSWKIHNIVSITHLEPIIDFHSRAKPQHHNQTSYQNSE